MFARSRENRIPFLLTSHPCDEIFLKFLPQKGAEAAVQRCSWKRCSENMQQIDPCRNVISSDHRRV